MEKSTVYFTDFRCKVGTSQLDKLKKLCIADVYKRQESCHPHVLYNEYSP